MKKLDEILLYVYIFLGFLLIYNLDIKDLFLKLMIIISSYFFIRFLKKNKKKTNSIIYLLILEMIISLVLNLSLYHLKYYLVNILSIISYYYIVKNYEQISLRVYYYLLNIINFFNFCFFLIFPGIDASEKEIFGIIFERRALSFLNLSSASIIASFCLIVSIYEEKYLNKCIKLTSIVLSSYLIMITGKITIFLSIIIVLCLYIFFKFFKMNFLNKVLIKVTISFFFVSSFVFIYLKSFLNRYINVDRIFSGRMILWEDFWRYILNQEKINIFFGNGFFNKKISYLYHPHNQYLTIIYILGIVGGILFFIIFYKAIVNSYYKNKVIFNLLICMIVLMAGDDYFILTIAPIGNIILFIALKNDRKDK